ncbi:hypothetical protein U5A82_02955 [Sphingobium sp. CR2-8]|uniref:hypothetical protein n=1 Tax=Sphingobium sp. CR2-8 TaxID=1306534 RepID=UPI002DB85CEC|nr:hypothetical protein [Sphingobium sp. CR2-8]MEC3909467.1 hypothetical protein [Sphingobium sp. CR2-8]
MDFPNHAAFSRRDLPALIGVPASRLGNWLDRLSLWQDMPIIPGAAVAYRLSHLFDLVGLAAMLDLGLPAAEAAKIVRNFGFYRTFLHDPEQTFRLTRLGDNWSASWSPDDILTVSINTRAIGQHLLEHIAALDLAPSYRVSFEALIGELTKRDRIDARRILGARVMA